MLRFALGYLIGGMVNVGLLMAFMIAHDEKKQSASIDKKAKIY